MSTQEDLEKALRAELVKQQDIVFGIVGGLAAALVGAIFWAAITVATNYQIGYMAIAVGLLVGFTVRYFGAGIDYYFGIIGAFFALFGCLLGNLLSTVGFAANEEGVSYFEIIGRLDLGIIISLYKETFQPMDVFFYAIAAYEGYRFGYRNIQEELANAVAAGKVEPPRYASLRLPVVIGLVVCLGIVGYFVATVSDGMHQYKYESGALQASGAMSGGKPGGVWEYWWENGQKQATGSFVDGKEQGEWIYYHEDGTVQSKGPYEKGFREGEWFEFYPNGVVSAKGQYTFGRMSGPWEYRFENGQIMSRGNHWLDLYDGEWEMFFENGNPLSKGKYEQAEHRGVWTVWYENGNKKSEIDYVSDTDFKILNTWNEDGKSVITNGNGQHKEYFDDGVLFEEGTMKDGLRFGTWTSYYSDGKKKETGDYKDKVYYVKTLWLPGGEEAVSNGIGYGEYYHEDGSKLETGKIDGGLRVDVWKTFYPTSGELSAELTYKSGKLNGLSKTYDISGYVTIEGNFVNGKRDGLWKWYSSDGVVESEVNFVNGKKDGDQKFYDTSGNHLKTEVYKDGNFITANII